MGIPPPPPGRPCRTRPWPPASGDPRSRPSGLVSIAWPRCMHQRVLQEHVSRVTQRHHEPPGASPRLRPHDRPARARPRTHHEERRAAAHHRQRPRQPRPAHDRGAAARRRAGRGHRGRRPTRARGSSATDVDVVIGDHRRERVLREAGVLEASSLVLTRDDDLGNLHAALLARELNPALRLVIRVFDAQIAERLPDLIDNAVALSSSALAAPGFVAAALEGEGGEQFTLAGRRFVVRLAGDHDTPRRRAARHLDRPDGRRDPSRPVGGPPARPGRWRSGLAGRARGTRPRDPRAARAGRTSATSSCASATGSRAPTAGSSGSAASSSGSRCSRPSCSSSPSACRRLDAVSWAIGLLTGAGTGFAGVDEASRPGGAQGLRDPAQPHRRGPCRRRVRPDHRRDHRRPAARDPGPAPDPPSIRDHVIVCGLGLHRVSRRAGDPRARRQGRRRRARRERAVRRGGAGARDPGRHR